MAVDDLDRYFSQYPFPFRRSTEIRNKIRNMIALNAFNNPSNDSFNFCGTNEKSSEIRRDVRIVRIGVNDLNPEIIVNTLNFDYDLGNRLRKSSYSRHQERSITSSYYSFSSILSHDKSDNS